MGQSKLPPPILLTFVVCDQIILDAHTGKHSIIGAFQTIDSGTYPARHPWLAIFTEWTNGHGKVDIRIQLVDVKEDDKVLGKTDCSMSLSDVRQIGCVALNIGGIEFGHPGEYRFQAYANGDLVGERRIVCRQIERIKGGEDE